MSHTLPVGMLHGPATLENSSAVSSKINQHTYDPARALKGIENPVHECLSSFVCTSPELETPRCLSMDEWLNKMAHPYHGKVLSNKRWIKKT